MTFICTDLLHEKACEAAKEKKPVLSNWPHLNVRRHNFDFHLSNIVVAVDLFVVIVDLFVVICSCSCCHCCW